MTVGIGCQRCLTAKQALSVDWSRSPVLLLPYSAFTHSIRSPPLLSLSLFSLPFLLVLHYSPLLLSSVGNGNILFPLIRLFCQIKKPFRPINVLDDASIDPASTGLRIHGRNAARFFHRAAATMDRPFPLFHACKIDAICSFFRGLASVPSVSIVSESMAHTLGVIFD